jgi:hypothetical protein
MSACDGYVLKHVIPRELELAKKAKGQTALGLWS